MKRTKRINHPGNYRSKKRTFLKALKQYTQSKVEKWDNADLWETWFNDGRVQYHIKKMKIIPKDYNDSH